MPVHRDHMRLEWVTSYRILQPSSPAVFLLTAVYVYTCIRHLHKQRSSCRSCQNLGLQTENWLAKQNSDIIYLWLHCVSFEFNSLQTFVRTFHLSDGQAGLHEFRERALVIGKASVGPWNSQWLEKCTLKYAANFFITHWIYKTCFKRDLSCSMRNSTLRYPFTNDWRERVP